MASNSSLNLGGVQLFPKIEKGIQKPFSKIEKAC